LIGSSAATSNWSVMFDFFVSVGQRTDDDGCEDERCRCCCRMFIAHSTHARTDVTSQMAALPPLGYV